MPKIGERAEQLPHTYPISSEAVVRSWVGSYNKIFFERFWGSGIPSLIEQGTGIRFRPLNLREVNQGKLVQVHHITSPEWEAQFRRVLNAQGWLAVNEIPDFSDPGQSKEKISIGMIQGLGPPWPEEGVQSAEVIYHPSGFVKVIGMTGLIARAEIGKRDKDNRTLVKKAIAEILNGNFPYNYEQDVA